MVEHIARCRLKDRKRHKGEHAGTFWDDGIHLYLKCRYCKGEIFLNSEFEELEERE